MFGFHIMKEWDQIYRDMKELVAIPSVKGEAKPGKPLGEGPYDALMWFLRKAEEMGLEVFNAGNKAGHAEYGQGAEYDGVLVHLDVVPAGEGWETDPFVLTEKEGILYGRGIADDKGFAVIALYCLKVLKDMDVRGRRKMRVIFGADEECGMEDMREYFHGEKPQPLPYRAFTPDVEYTVCNREKGILQFRLVGNKAEEIEVCAGQAVNAAAGTARAEVKCTEQEFAGIQAAAQKVPCETQWNWKEGRASLSMKGRASHAMEPQKGINAAQWMLQALSSLPVIQQEGVCRFVLEELGIFYDGNKLGISCEDKESGPLTLNVGNLFVGGGKNSTVSIDIRYPVTVDGEKIVEKIKSKAEAYGLKMEILEHKAPLYLPESDPFIQLLVSAYEDVSGRKAVVYSTGGGTYARTLQGRGVGFGGAFQESGDTCVHSANEHISVDDLKLHAQICLEAMYRMMTEDSELA